VEARINSTETQQTVTSYGLDHVMIKHTEEARIQGKREGDTEGDRELAMGDIADHF